MYFEFLIRVLSGDTEETVPLADWKLDAIFFGLLDKNNLPNQVLYCIFWGAKKYSDDKAHVLDDFDSRRKTIQIE